MNNFISTDSKDFEYLLFGNSQRKTEESTVYYLRQKLDGSDYSLYAIVFSPTITKELRKKAFPYLRIKVNRLTCEIYFVFSKEKYNGSLNVKTYGGKQGRLCVYNKELVVFIMDTVGIEKGNRVIRDIEISPNKSRIDDVLVYQLLGANK